MVSRALIDEFLAQKSLALVGVSRDGKGFGNVILGDLSRKGFAVRVVHHEAEAIAGRPCVRLLSDIAGEVGGLVLVTAPIATTQLVREAAEAGIRRVWMQQGAESEEAVNLCREHGIAAVYGQCILMFAEPAGFPHGLHRAVCQVLGQLPK